MKKLTEKQKSILDFVKDVEKQRGVRPSYRQIMRQFNYSSVSTVALHMKALEKKGFLQEDVKETGVVPIPLIGHFTDGKPLDISAGADVNIPIPASELQTCASCYVLQVRGDELKESAILDGDLLLIEARSHFESDEIVFAQTDHGVILRKIDFQGSHFSLKPILGDRSVLYAQEDLVVQAVLLKLVRRF